MEIKFTKNGEKFVSEFTATADFNLHLEGVVEGKVKVYQRSTAEGEYAYVRAATPYPSFSNVYDYDFSALVYPKYIKVVTDVEPEVASVVTDGEVIPSAGGGARNFKYYRFNDGAAGYFAIYSSEAKTNEAIGAYYAVLNGTLDFARIIAVKYDLDAVMLKNAEVTRTVAEMLNEILQEPETAALFTEITKEEFYNLN